MSTGGVVYTSPHAPASCASYLHACAAQTRCALVLFRAAAPLQTHSTAMHDPGPYTKLNTQLILESRESRVESREPCHCLAWLLAWLLLLSATESLLTPCGGWRMRMGWLQPRGWRAPRAGPAREHAGRGVVGGGSSPPQGPQPALLRALRPPVSGPPRASRAARNRRLRTARRHRHHNAHPNPRPKPLPASPPPSAPILPLPRHLPPRHRSATEKRASELALPLSVPYRVLQDALEQPRLLRLAPMLWLHWLSPPYLEQPRPTQR